MESLLGKLACPECKHGELIKSSGGIICAGCAKNFAVRDNKVFFIEPPSDIFISNQTSDSLSWTPWRKGNFKFFKEKLASEPQAKSLLDVGAGPSQFRELFQKFNTVSVDFYPYERIDVVADFTKGLPFREGEFDIVVLSNVLEHVPTPESFVRECGRVLKRGGAILGTVPFLSAVHQVPHDYLRYTPYMLQKILRDFANVEILPLGGPMDAYLSQQRRFFKRNQLWKLWRIQKLFNKLISLSSLTPASLEYAEGYGFKAVKEK